MNTATKFASPRSLADDMLAVAWPILKGRVYIFTVSTFLIGFAIGLATYHFLAR